MAESGERIPKKLASLGFGRRATPAQKTQVVQKLRQKHKLENDEYYGSQRARDAYDGLHGAYLDAGWTEAEIGTVLRMQTPDNAWFAQRGIRGNYHGGGNALFEEADILDWITEQRKGSGAPEAALPFTDVDADAWYAGAVTYVFAQGLMSGTSDTAFTPDGLMTRGMLAGILYRAAGSPQVTGRGSFTDVPEESWYSGGTAWAAENGIINGYGDGRFGPNDPVTREQFAAILWRNAGSPATEPGQDFSDESAISPYAAQAVDWVRSNGLMSGISGSRFAPKENATRAQAAMILMNA